MLCVILCGGSGTRFAGQIWPKPMNMIDGRPMFAWNIDGLRRNLPPRTRFLILHNVVLSRSDFPRLVRRWFPDVEIDFIEVPYATRGALETGYVGMRRWLSTQPAEVAAAPVVFCDNDIALSEPVSVPTGVRKWPFMLVQHNADPAPIYSYVQPAASAKPEDALAFPVAAVHEKQKVSDWIGVGVYGFPRISGAVEVFAEIIGSPPVMNAPAAGTGGEYFLSTAYSHLCARGEPVFALKTTRVGILGTPANAAAAHVGSFEAAHRELGRRLRFVFDLDETLVTAPTTPGAYTSVRPIAHVVAWARELKREGHTIVVSTPRLGDLAEGGAADGSKADVPGLLERLQIPYDEIVAATPPCDFTIHSRAVNAWDPGAMRAMGFYRHTHLSHVPDGFSGTPLLRCTDFNRHGLDPTGKRLVKRGPTPSLRGETYFYDQLERDPQLVGIRALFPRRLGVAVDEGHGPNESVTTLTLEYLAGAPLSLIYRHSIVAHDLFRRVLAATRALHEASTTVPVGTRKLIADNYVDKMDRRFLKRPEHYAFVERSGEAREVYQHLREFLVGYVASPRARPVAVVHGDCWFANIMIDREQQVKFIDMRGCLAGELTTCGDPVYDWAKLYQSIVGFDDAVLFHDAPPEPQDAQRERQRQLLTAQLQAEVEAQHIAWQDVRMVACALMFGSYWAVHALLGVTAKRQLWQVILGGMAQRG